MRIMQPTGTRPPHTIDERIAAAPGRLPPSVSKVVRFFTEHREEVVFLSAADIAASLEVSDATVIRAAQALGYRGLPELKQELREAMRERNSPALRFGRSLDALAGDGGADGGALLDHLVGSQIEILADARQSLRADDFQRSLELLVRARRIVVLGQGPLGPLADYFVVAMRRFGRSAFALTGRGWALADGLMELRAGDVLVVLAYERRTSELEVSLDRAAELGIGCVLVTDHLALALDGRYTVALIASRGATEAAVTITVPAVIVEALILGVMGRDRPRALAALQELAGLRKRLGIT